MSSPPSSYTSDISFHSLGHLQMWENSPLSNQNPHLWTAFLITFVLCSIVLGLKLYRNKKNNTRVDEYYRLDTLHLALINKQKHLEAKIHELKKNDELGNTPEKPVYEDLLKDYESSLNKIQRQIKEIEAESCREPNSQRGLKEN